MRSSRLLLTSWGAATNITTWRAPCEQYDCSMPPSHELLAILNQLGFDLDDLAVEVAKKAATETGVRAFGASKAVVERLIKKIRKWRNSEALEKRLADSTEA